MDTQNEPDALVIALVRAHTCVLEMQNVAWTRRMASGAIRMCRVGTEASQALEQTQIELQTRSRKSERVKSGRTARLTCCARNQVVQAHRSMEKRQYR